MTRDYTHRDAQGVRWRIDEGGRPISEIADWCNDSLRGPRLGETPSPTPTPTPTVTSSPSLSESESESPTPSADEEPSTETATATVTASPSWGDVRPSAAYSPVRTGAPTSRDRAAQTARADKAAAATLRARGLLVETIGEPAVAHLEGGGMYVVPSVRWPGTEYHIPKSGYIRVVRGGLWQDACLVSSDSRLPWPDVVLSRIKMIQVNETIVQQKANSQGISKKAKQLLDVIVNTLQGGHTP